MTMPMDSAIGLIDFEIAAAYRFYANGDSLEIEQSEGYPRYYGGSKDVLPPD